MPITVTSTETFPISGEFSYCGRKTHFRRFPAEDLVGGLAVGACLLFECAAPFLTTDYGQPAVTLGWHFAEGSYSSPPPVYAAITPNCSTREGSLDWNGLLEGLREMVSGAKAWRAWATTTDVGVSGFRYGSGEALSLVAPPWPATMTGQMVPLLLPTVEAEAL